MRSAIAVVFVFFGIFSVRAQTPDANQTRTDFESFASQLSYLSTNSVLYHRSEERFQVADPHTVEENARILKRVMDRAYPKKALLGLLTHDAPKVRTLAAVALFDREDASVLPALVALCADEAPTFDDHAITAQALGPFGRSLSGVAPPPVKQTVGDIASKMVAFYMTRGGFYYGVTHKSQPGFAQYWEARCNRSFCAGWFAVQLARASQGISPTQKQCLEEIRAVRQRIDALPADERTWTLLWLNGESGSDALASEEELVAACKKVGPDKLLLMLQNKIPSDDPDLQPRDGNNWPYARMALFVLHHADQLLRSSDSEELLACETLQRNSKAQGIKTAWWAVAAASLQPLRAAQILHAAMERFQGKFDARERSTLCAALWQFAGASEGGFVVEWFFNEKPERGAFPHCRGSFIEAVSKQLKGREIISRIIQDPRLSDLDWQSHERLVRAVNGWSKTPIVTEDEFRKAWHPFGQGHYDWQQAEAEQKYPKETAELRAHLDEWRERLRLSVPTWL